MQLKMCTIKEMKELSNDLENKAIDYYISKFPLRLDITSAKMLKIYIDINDDDTDVEAICKLLKNNWIALICVDLSDLDPEPDGFLSVNTNLIEKCKYKINIFTNIIKETLVDTSTYFKILDNEIIYNNEEINKYQLYLAQFNNGLIIQ